MNSQRRLLLMKSSAPKIYGVMWGKVSSPTLARTDASVGMVAGVGVDATPAVNDFDRAEIYREFVDVTDSLGNVFVRIPKFYIQKVDSANLLSIRISKKRWDSSWYLPYCFWDFTNSRELPYVDVGKYVASLNGTKLASVSGQFPLINKNIVDFRSYAQANGAGYQQMDLHTWNAIECLRMVEQATLNAQLKMFGWANGQYTATHLATVAENSTNRIIVSNATAALYVAGQPIAVGTTLGGNQIFYGRLITSIVVYDANNKAINFDGAPVNIAVGNILYNVGWKSGETNGVVAKSGSIVSNSDGLHPFKYRGIENLWGSVYQFVDGVNITDRQAWVCLNPANYASNLFASPYAPLSYVNSSSDGWITAVGFDPTYPFANFPTAVGGSNATYYSDYYYSSSSQRVALVGGNWYSGTYVGPSYWALTPPASYSNVNIGSRLLRKPL